jgi:hypothetical protein
MKTFIALIFFPILVFSQPDSARFVRTYFNKDLNITDSAKSVYVGYEFYQNQRPVYFGLYKYVDKYVQMCPSKYQLTEGKPIIINDTIVWKEYNRKGKLKGIDLRIYCNGYLKYLSYKHFLKDGTLAFDEINDHTHLYKNQIGSYYGCEKNKDGVVLKEYWFGISENNRWEFIYKQ